MQSNTLTSDGCHAVPLNAAEFAGGKKPPRIKPPALLADCFDFGWVASETAGFVAAFFPAHLLFTPFGEGGSAGTLTVGVAGRGGALANGAGALPVGVDHLGTNGLYDFAGGVLATLSMSTIALAVGALFLKCLFLRMQPFV
jgi:hypothetical protein